MSFIVFATLQILLASATRLQQNLEDGSEGVSTNRDLHVSMGAHAEGLESEHDFELITHDTSNSSGWTVTDADRDVIKDILEMLNPSGADAPWHWKNEMGGWTFGLVKLTAQDAKGSLALHMLHRHGLAPLLCARAGKAFDDFMEQRGTNSTLSNVEFLVESQEEFSMVQTLQSLLKDLTLSALRNLHSFDHQWSVNNWAYKVPDCSQRSAGGCILQGGVSGKAYSFLTGNGFLPHAIKKAEAESEKVMNGLNDGTSGLDMVDYQSFLTPDHTGKKTHSLTLVDMGFGVWQLVGDVAWEDGGLSRNVQLPLTSEQVKLYQDFGTVADRDAYVNGLFEAFVEKKIRNHKTFMYQNRLKVWTGEQAQFVGMFPKYMMSKYNQ